jgi:hypothetical protein
MAEMHQVLKAQMLERANAHTSAMQGMKEKSAFAYVRSVIDANQIVFGVYQDASEPDGVGMHVIKGIREIQAVMASGRPEGYQTDAVPCTSLEQAIAAEQKLGDGAHMAN